MSLMDTIMEFDSRISPVFEELSIKVISITTAHGPLQDYSIDFEFFTQTKLNTFTKEATTHITSMHGNIPGSISIGHQHQASLFIIPQSVHIECNYKLLQIDTNDMKRILQHPHPTLYYSEWLLDAIKNASILMELKTNQNTMIEWPLGIKSAVIL